MTYIKSACTPTLIQHGEKDARIPITNAYDLYQGLMDMEVDTELIIFKEWHIVLTNQEFMWLL